MIGDIVKVTVDRPLGSYHPKPRLTKKYRIGIRRLDKDYSTVMGMLCMMTRLGTAKRVTNTYKEVLNKEPQTFRQFVQKNLDAWKN